jgi:hypothetical protein
VYGRHGPLAATWRRICDEFCVVLSAEISDLTDHQMNHEIDMNTSESAVSALSAPTPLTPLSALPTALPDLHKEMFILGYCTELRALRRLQYVYERDSRVYWNRILYPEVLEETLYYCDTDHIICREIEFHMENKDLELAFYRASGPSVR